MATLESGSGKLQEFASIAIPGEWIENDEGMAPTTSKIGGHSNVFELWHRSHEQVKCPICGKWMYLLVQMNAPLVHEMCQRNVYLFMCHESQCTKTNKGWKVMVCRGPKVTHFENHQKRKSSQATKAVPDIHRMIKSNNKMVSKQLNGKSFWNHNLTQNAVDSEIMDSSHEEKQQEIKSKLDGLNDDFARLMAMQQSLLKQVDHQKQKIQHQQSRKPKAQIATPKVSKSMTSQKRKAVKGGFVPFELVFQDEMYYEQMKPKEDEKVIVVNDRKIDLKQLMQTVPDQSSADCNGVEEGKDEEVFTDYLERIKMESRQCVRYCYGAQPLVPQKIDLEKIPKCEHCGKRMVFEFQVMSSVLMHLIPRQFQHEWLTALVFVCPATCQTIAFSHVVVCCEP